MFTRPATGWAATAAGVKLTKPSPSGSDDFGESVSVSGDGGTVVVGAYNFGSGAAYVFTKPTTGWAATSTAARLTASDGATGNHFGYRVAVNNDGSMVAIGEPDRGSGTHRGAVHLFARPAAGWGRGTSITTAHALSATLPTETGQGRRGWTASIGGNLVVTTAYLSGSGGTWVYGTSAARAPTPTPTPTPTATPR